MKRQLSRHHSVFRDAFREAAGASAGAGRTGCVAVFALTALFLGVLCPEADAQVGEWAWMAGSSTFGPYGSQPGVYGTLGVPAAENVPGGREGASTWTDFSGNFWLFGGVGYAFDLAPVPYLNDLWEFNPSSKEWAWMGGSSGIQQPGVYGTLGVPAASNVPGARSYAARWTDASGNFWLFGGYGFDSAGTLGLLNDLWQFNPCTNEWAWMGGSSTVPTPCPNSPTSCGQPGVYGTLGVPAAGNVPGGRNGTSTWTDASGNFWLFGGGGYDSAGTLGGLNDLWEFNPSTREWAWVGGSSTLELLGNDYGRPGVYGTLGVPGASNVPGARGSAANWTDASGNSWLFGGLGYDSAGTTGFLNDLWEFNPSSREWAWMGGSSTVPGSEEGEPGVYGTLGVLAAENVPGGRSEASSWTDAGGNFWLFDGWGYDSAGTWGQLNDLWQFNPSTHEWAWMGGSRTVIFAQGGEPGVYGTLGVPAAGNVPGGRYDASSWTDISGNFWLFGGVGRDSTGCGSYDLNDLWEYEFPPNSFLPIASGAPTGLTFGAQPTGTTSASQPVTLSNTGTASLTIASIATSGDFSQTNTCGGRVAPSGSCTINVTFRPTAPGTLTGTLTITDNSNGAAGSTQTVNLTGTGLAPAAGVSPGSLNFGNQVIGTTSASQPVTLSNTGNATLTIASISTSANFGQTNACMGGVAASGSCTISVTFSPTTSGTLTGTLTITDNSNGAAGSIQTVNLSGMGMAPAPVASVSPGSLTFVSRILKTTSAPQSVALSNTGTAALTIASISTSANFGQTNTCALGVAAGGSCTINVTFSPTTAGTLTGTLTITDNSNGVAGSTQSVALSGTGQDFSFAPPSGSSTSATVAPGSTATYTLSVGGEGGFNQSVSFACAGAPSEATCTVSPNQVAAGSSATNITVSVTTTAPSLSVPRSRPLPPALPLSPGLRGLLMLALVLALMAWAIGRWNQLGVSRWLSTMIPLASGLLLALALAGCGGGGGGGVHNPGTPAGTYTLTVTGTAGSGPATVSHSVTLTLIVS